MGRINNISKKTIAVAFAVMLAVASISIAAFANQSDPYVNAEITAKWLVLDEAANTYVDAIEDKTPDTDHGENQSINAEYARPGDSVRADIYFQSDTPVDNISLLYTFDEDLLEVDWTKFNRNGNVYYLTGYNGYTGSAAPGKPALSQLLSENDGIIPEDVTFEGLDAISISGYCGQFKDYTNPTLITSIFFTVKSSATVKPGSGPAVVTVPEYTYFTSDLNDLGFNTSYMINVEDPLEPGESLDSSYLNLTLVNNSQQLLFGGDVNFDAIDGYGTIGTGSVATVHGYYDTALSSSDIPSVTPEDDVVLIGWSTSLASGDQTDGEGNTVLGGKYSDMIIDCDDIQDSYDSIKFEAPENADTLYAVYAYAPTSYSVNVYTQKLDSSGQPMTGSLEDSYELYGEPIVINGRVNDTITPYDINPDWFPDSDGFIPAFADPADGMLVLGVNPQENLFKIYCERRAYNILWKININDSDVIASEVIYYGADAGTAFYPDPVLPAFLSDTDSSRFGYKVSEWSDHEMVCADKIFVTAQLEPVDVTVRYHNTDLNNIQGSFASGNGVFEVNKQYGDSISSADFTDVLTPPEGYHFADNAAVYTNSAGTQTAVTDLGALPDILNKSNYYCLDTQNETIIIDVYPAFEIDTGDITFDANGGLFAGGNQRVDSYEYGQSIYVPAESDFASLKSETDDSGVTSYYTFKGWGAASDSTETVSVDSTFITDKTYYAVWEDNRINISFIGKNSTAVLEEKRNITEGKYVLLASDFPPAESIHVDEGEIWVWEVEAGTEITANIVITGHSEYQFEYCWKDSNNTDNSTNAVYLAEGEALPANPMPEVTGYEFKGWYSDYGYNDLFCLAGDEGNCQMPDSSLTLYGYYDAIEYTVTYYSEEEDTEAYATNTPVYYNQDIPVPAQPHKDGYTFGGWVYYNLDEDDNVAGVYSGSKMPANSLKAVAIWTVHTFTIDFDSNEGSEVTDITEEYGADIVWPDNPVREGHSFVDWHIDTVNGAVYSDRPATMPLIGNEDGAVLNLVAEWRVNNYTVEYDFDVANDDPDQPAFTDASQQNSESIAYNANLTNPEASRTGYTFVGWTYWNLDENDNVTTEHVTSKMPANNLKAVAGWLPHLFTIDFDSNSGSAVSDITGEYRESITWPDDPVKEGNEFVAWHIDTVDGQVYSDRPTTMPLIADEDEATLKLIAEWRVLSYNITYDLNDEEGSRAAFAGSGDHPDTLAYGSDIPNPAVTRTGYSFTGWTVTYTDGDQNEQTLTAGTSTMPAYSVNYKAEWVKDPIITFYADAADEANNNVYYTLTIPYGTAVTDSMIPDDPEREGYDFDGWQPDLTGENITEDTDVIGSFTVQSYTLYITVPADHTQDTSVTVDYGETISDYLPADITVEKYLFNGWIYYTDEALTEDYLYEEETMPASNIYAVADMERIDPIVKLMPLNENSKAMIERNSVVETYNAGILDGTLRLPTRNQLTAIAADEESYEYPQYAENAAEYNSWYLYGLRTGLTTNGLADYVTVTNGGYYVIEGAYRGRIATGTVIKVYDKDDNFVEQFRAVIYGDINGDGNVTGTDLQKADYEVITKTFSSNEGKVETPYLFRAADLNQDGNFTGVDDQRFNEVIPGMRVVDQVTGRAEVRT